MFKPQEGIGHFGADVPGPPWILGHRGTPREAPENTLASLVRAVALGLDGFEYDVHACATGELCLLHDPTLDRTTNAKGPLAALTLPELFGVDAGSWFAPQFAGEPVPLVSEALDIPADRPPFAERGRPDKASDPTRGGGVGIWPQHMIELKEDGLVPELDRLLSSASHPLAVRVASFSRNACLDARDAGWPAMLLVEEVTDAVYDFVRAERVAAVGTAARGWDVPAGERAWPCERWAWSVDEPDELLAACRRPLNGFNTNEPRRALAVRALCTLAPGWSGGYPIEAPELAIEAGAFEGLEGEWCGRWRVPVTLVNPFPFAAEVEAAFVVDRGAFEVGGLPQTLRLAPGERHAFELAVSGGSWSPGGDPRLVARYRWRRGPGRPPEELAFDATLHRVREARLGERTVRLPLLRERPGALPASLTLRRSGDLAIVALENPGELEDARVVVRLGGRTQRGGRSVRMRLPESFLRTGQTDFTCGLEGRRDGRPVLQRWAGWLGEPLLAGVPGRLVATPS